MSAKNISNRLASVGVNLESAWNRLVVRVRTQHMPKGIKSIKHTLQGKQRPGGFSGEDVQFDYAHREAVQEGMTFYPRYMGSTLIEELVDPEPGANYFNTGLSTKALDRIISMCRKKELVKVSMNVSPKGIQVIESRSRNVLVDVGMERVSFCTNDKKYSKVTAFISRNYVNETMECHAFLCDKTKMAQSMAKVISQAYGSHKRSVVTEVDEEVQHMERQYQELTAHDVNEEDCIQSNEELTQSEDSLIDTSISPPVSMRKPSTRMTSYKAQTQEEPNHNLFSLDDDFMPKPRERSDSDTFAMFATANTRDSSNVMDDEFSSFARSRSQNNLHDMHTSVHSGWDI